MPTRAQARKPKQSSHRRDAIFNQRIVAAALIVEGEHTTTQMVAELVSRFGFSRRTAFSRIREARTLLESGRTGMAFAVLGVTKRRTR